MAATCADGNSSALCPTNATNWCIVEATCNVHLKECVQWPRCRTPPLLGCASEQQLCVNTELWPNATRLVPGLFTFIATSNDALAVYTIVLVAMVVLVAVTCFVGYHRRHFFKWTQY